MPDDDDDRPWTEAQWEAFMKKSDARADRFGELLETFMDDPDCHAKVAREMGWLDDDEDGEDQSEEFSFDNDDADDSFNLETAAEDEADDDDDEWDDDNPRAFRDREMEGIPSYGLASKVAEEIADALDPWLKQKREIDDDGRLGEAFIGCHIAAAKISGGHGMGYDDHVLCGNIVNCKRGLAGAQQSRNALISLRDDKILPASVVDPLLPRVDEVIRAVEERIAELRSRVWW
jgi:hypothetical protein